MTSEEARKPPMQHSDEANERQLDLAREQGSAIEKALHHMANEEADDGGEVAAGDYRIAYAVEEAEGMHMFRDGELTWVEPGEENCHLEVCVRDGADGRFVPALDVTATLVDAEGREVGTHAMPFLWHPWLYHYGRNWRVPGGGSYTLKVHVEPPQFPRHDLKNGSRYAEAVDVTFENVRIQAGQKHSTR